MTRMDHVAEALRVLGEIKGLDDIATSSNEVAMAKFAVAQAFAAAAQVHATLAVAEQQRIANLIALWTTGKKDAEAPVREGLGL